MVQNINGNPASFRWPFVKILFHGSDLLMAWSMPQESRPIRWKQAFHASSSEWRNGSLWTGQVAANQIFLHGTVRIPRTSWEQDWNVVNSLSRIIGDEKLLIPTDIFLWSPGALTVCLSPLEYVLWIVHQTAEIAKRYTVKKNGCSSPTSCYIHPPVNYKSYFKLLLKTCIFLFQVQH